MMPTLRAAILAVGLACAAPTTPSTGAAAAPPRTDTMPVVTGMAPADLAGPVPGLRRRRARPGREGRPMIQTTTTARPCRCPAAPPCWRSSARRTWSALDAADREYVAPYVADLLVDVATDLPPTA